MRADEAEPTEQRGDRPAAGGAYVSAENVRVRLLFVDEGRYHHEEIQLPAGALEGYARLIDCLREEPEVLTRVFVDVDRLCAAYRVAEEEEDGEADGDA